MLSLHILLDTSVIHGVDSLCVEIPTARGQIHSHRELQRENACAGHQLWLHWHRALTGFGWPSCSVPKTEPALSNAPLKQAAGTGSWKRSTSLPSFTIHLSLHPLAPFAWRCFIPFSEGFGIWPRSLLMGAQLRSCYLSTDASKGEIEPGCFMELRLTFLIGDFSKCNIWATLAGMQRETWPAKIKLHLLPTLT